MKLLAIFKNKELTPSHKAPASGAGIGIGSKGVNYALMN